MSQIVVKRPPRVLPPGVPSEDLQLQPPPELPRGQQEGVLMQLLPMLGMGGSVVFFFMPNAHPFMRIMGMVMIASTIAMLIATLVRFRRGTQGEMAQLRRDYLKYLAQMRRRVRRTAHRQRDAQFYLHPAPDQLWALVAEGSRVWERRAGDDDFVHVRVGLGTQRLATALVAPETAPVDELEPLTAGAMHQFLQTHGTVDGLPMAVSLRAFYHMTVSGAAESVHGAVRAMVASLVALHSPDDLVVGVVAGRGAEERWEWAKWLPHAQAAGTADGAGTRRLITGDVAELEGLLGAKLEGRPRFNSAGQPLLDQPHVLIVLDGGATVPPGSMLASAEGLQSVTVVEVVPGEIGSPRGGLSVVVHPDRLRLESGHGAVYEGRPDALSPEAAEALARQLAPLRMGTGGDGDEPLLANLEFTDLLNLGDAASVDVRRTWRPRSTAERLRVPIGVGEDGQPVMLDLKEAAQDGMGPHGLCVGATGSGKSELLRTLVLGLAVTHTSEALNFVLADFKGGATFAGMSQMPHVAAVITNLADDLSLVDRMGDSIRGELNRRQELLRDAGNYANIHDYERARAAGAPLVPIPSLVLVIDEFSELLTAKPDFIDMFIQIGRIGRSLGVHLLLASQRLEEGRLRGLETYLSYRIGLRTFSASESRAALGVPDAYHLPSVPGSGYLKFGTEEMLRFKAAYVSGVYRPSTSGAGTPAGPLPADRHPVLFTAAPVPVRHAEPARRPAPEPEPAAGPDDDALADTVLDVIVRRLENQGPAAHQVWLPPLDEAPPLDELLPGLTAVPDRGLTQPDYPHAGRLTVPLGLVDKPYEQRRETLLRDFSGAAGHMLVVGGPQSGKSTLLRTLVCAFALTHTPQEVQFYGLDFGGGGLTAVAGLPHVGGIASRLDPERVRRTVAEVAGILAQREEYFRANGIDSIATYRRRRARGEITDQPWGDVFLVVDGWGAFRQEYDMLEETVTAVAARGLGYGIHVVISVARYMEVRPALKDQLMNRLELRLGDTLDSEFDRKVAANVPADTAGRGQTPEKLHFMTAVPRIDGVCSDEELSEATAALNRAVADAWHGPSAPQVRLLPRELPAHQLPKGSDYPQHGVAFGIDENTLQPVFVDFETDPFFLVFGESESGKTALLRLLAKQITERYTPDEARIVVADYRRALLGNIPDSHLIVYAAMSNAMDSHMAAMKELMEKRTPPEDVTPQQLRDRSWWAGPKMFLIVDDYELVSTSSGNPLAAFTELLPFARDIGVCLIIARNSAGASRSSFEPFMQRVKELGAQGVVLSGDPSEGDLLGNVRPRPMPPGRGYYVSRRRGTPLVQVGWLPAR
ncbi:type VII secretion protein EccCa [Streptomyces sp. TRM 70361]|uniref:type VII secretion protein EccCa n=1 Tax=Streptomyces sp. TRM 70361 TaxID=3116553 RepID=UPI002E7BEE64|nr:type VII secretion protein EccCa [Streptomyces sp. TRM 70361]MEE1941772.1 type VII secretion protein EccCa [Streptomyces sp. TRM 70361]